MKTYGGPGAAGAQVKGAAGTVYREKASEEGGYGMLVINNANRTNTYASATNVYTEIPAITNSDVIELKHMTLSITNGAWVGIVQDTEIGDLWMDTTTPTRLFLKGYKLTVGSSYHSDWG